MTKPKTKKQTRKKAENLGHEHHYAGLIDNKHVTICRNCLKEGYQDLSGRHHGPVFKEPCYWDQNYVQDL